MELQNFVNNAITQVISAVDSLNTSRRVTFKSHQGKRTIEFDIAVTAESSDSLSGGGGIKVLSLIEAGAKGNTETKNSVVSRISFGIDIDEYTDQEKAEHERQMRALQQSLSSR